jgi:hypothetical protein
MKKENKLIIAISLLCLVLILSVYFRNPELVQGSAPSGLPATIATSSKITVTTTPILVFATSSCASRIITTTASPIMISFSDDPAVVLTGQYGHLQGASTTVAYDSGQYGCNNTRIYSFASGAITVSESR